MPDAHRFCAGAAKQARDAERRRFNRLSPEAAKAILEQMEGQQCVPRSCWYCNAAHEHLKQKDHPIICLWGCGQIYLGGFPASIVARRAAGKKITDEMMLEWEAEREAQAQPQQEKQIHGKD